MGERKKKGQLLNKKMNSIFINLKYIIKLIDLYDFELMLFWSCVIFVLGLAGLVSSQRSVIAMMLCLELMLLSSVMLLITSSMFFQNFAGLTFALFILVISAAESAVGLSLVLFFYQKRNTVSHSFLNLITS